MGKKLPLPLRLATANSCYRRFYCYRRVFPVDGEKKPITTKARYREIRRSVCGGVGVKPGKAPRSLARLLAKLVVAMQNW